MSVIAIFAVLCHFNHFGCSTKMSYLTLSYLILSYHSLTYEFIALGVRRQLQRGTSAPLGSRLQKIATSCNQKPPDMSPPNLAGV